MTSIANNTSKVPMMFRAQLPGRCQLQYAQSHDAERWVEEWTREAYFQAPEFGTTVQTRPYQISWRFITNGGQDDGIIRPVIGARGFPFYPGSSMKGAFRRSCEVIQPEQCDRYCGDAANLKPGILRFHGGYPSSNVWTDSLVDVVHPQQGWQVGIPGQGGHSAKVLISLYKPELQFGISSAVALMEAEWGQIWQVWEKALSMGIGCRASAGYGQPTRHSKGTVLYRAQLRGQGQTAKLLDGSTEFRPNIFRAALRGHALRIFGGLTTAENAEKLVEQLFGGIQGAAQVGLLSLAFHQTSPEQEWSNTYKVEGELKWLLTRSLPEEERATLQKLTKQLIQFAMLLGGFGKSWRRADHRLFLPDYDEHLIGCHWQWTGQRSPVSDNPARKLQDVTTTINNLRETAKSWIQQQGTASSATSYADWREAWYEGNVQVWGRVADAADESAAIEWLHGRYSTEYEGRREIALTIKNTSVTGKLNQIGRLWHRMYPVILRQPDPNDPKKALPKPTKRYLELMTLFLDNSTECKRFLQFLASKETDFEKLW